MVKRKIHKYAYLRIFGLTTSRSQKLIPKADLKWEWPYFYSKFFCLKSFGQYLKKPKHGFSFIFSKSDLTWVVARGLTVKSLRINPSSSNFLCVTQTKRIRPLEMKLPEFFRTRTLKLFQWTFFTHFSGLFCEIL